MKTPSKKPRARSVLGLCALWLSSAVVAAAVTNSTVSVGSYRSYNPYAFGVNSTNIQSTSMQQMAANPTLVNDLASLAPTVIRYPGGTTGNYWDWVNSAGLGKDANNNPLYQGHLGENRPTDLKTLISAAGLSPVRYFVVLDMLTQGNAGTNYGEKLPVPDSDDANATWRTRWRVQLAYQARMIKNFFSATGTDTSGVELYIELGNEFYDAHASNDPDTANVYPFTDTNSGAGKEYARAALLFIDEFANRIYDNDQDGNQDGPDFQIGNTKGNKIKFGVVAVQARYASSPKQASWNNEIITAFSSLDNTRCPDAYVFHEYLTTTIGNGAANGAKVQLTSSNMSTFITDAWNQTNTIQNSAGYERSLVRDGATPSRNGGGAGEIWYTEFNLAEQKPDSTGHGPYIAVHGTWGHGLYVGLTALRLLDVPTSDTTTLPQQHMLLHAHTGNDATYSAIIAGTTGYRFNGTDTSLVPDGALSGSTILSTTAGQLSSVGQVISMIGNAIDQAANPANPKLAPLAFTAGGSGAPPDLYGFAFKQNGDAAPRAAIILNLSSTTYSLTLSSGSFATATPHKNTIVAPPSFGFCPTAANPMSPYISVTANGPDTFTVGAYSAVLIQW